jgi:GNAT superfamily N-acetyltransferase
VGPRVDQARLLRTRDVTTATEEPLDADDVWAVSCFVVRKAHRGQGLMKKLLHAAVSTAREAGARGVRRRIAFASIAIEVLLLLLYFF